MLCTAIITLASIGHAATVAISPPTVPNDASTQVTLTISGLAAGQTVDVDRYADLNGDGEVDAGEPLMHHFTITDGQVPRIGGQRNLNVPGDDDGQQDGSIQAKLFYPGVSPLDRIAASYLYQVSDPLSLLPFASASLTVTQNTTLSQGVHGTITAAGTGLPLPHAMVALIANDLVSGTVTDASGQYTLYAPPGSYAVIPVFPGYVVNQGDGSVDVMSAQFTTKDMALASANLTVSGSVTDASAGVGLPGMFVICESSSLFAAGFTDAAGNYTVQVTSGQWNISPNPEDAAALGYVSFWDETQTNITANLTRNFTLPKATALVFGTVQDGQGHPVLGLRMRGHNQSNQEPGGRTFAPDGAYSIGVLAGAWNVGPSQDEVIALGYLPEDTTLSVQAGQALRHDFTLQNLTITAHVSGRLVRDTASGPGIGNLNAYACPQAQGSCLSANTGSDGSFDLGLFAGTWNIGFSSEQLAQQNLVAPQFTITVADGVNQTGFIAVAIAGTAHISGTVRDSQLNPIAGLNVYAGANIGGMNYNANSQTDTNGYYSMLAADGNWQVGINCDGLSDRGYACANNQPALINHADRMVDFVVHPPVPSCIGDCGDNHLVTVDEILALVNIALGNANVSTCEAGNANHDGSITVDEILTAVNNALNGCPPS